MADTCNANTLRLGVRELAEFACREGDLERGPAGPTAEQGRLAHQRLQRSQSGLLAEVSLSRCCTVDGYEVTLAGRMDLLDESEPRLIEIKSTLVPYARLPLARQHLDRAQLGLYAWLWQASAGRGMPALELRYVNLRSELIESVEVTLDAQACNTLVLQALRCRVAFEKSLRRRRQALKASALTLQFPHGGMRSGQRTLAVASYRSLRDGKALVAQAPTGSGKTLATLFPAMKSLGQQHVDRVVWLTAKSSGRDAACAALSQLAGSGLDVDALVLRSRRAACPCEALRHESGDVTTDGHGDLPCTWTVDYHQRLRGARQALMDTGPGICDGAVLDGVARAHRLCPAALATDLLPWFPVVVCDYNHVFDPVAASARLLDDAPRQALLVDEAHNLPRRGQEMYSAGVSREQCRHAARDTARGWPDLSRALKALGRSLTSVAGTMAADSNLPNTDQPVVYEQFPEKVLHALKRVAECLANPPEAAAFSPGGVRLSPTGSLARLAMDVHRLLLIETRWMRSHRCLVHWPGTGKHRDVVTRMVCLDAAEALGRTTASFHAAVLMSATLMPMKHFQGGFGLPEHTSCVDVESPFDASQWHCQVIDWIGVTFRERQGSLPQLVDLVARVTSARAGHYLVFLPSFTYLEALHDAYTCAYPGAEAWRQPRSADAEAVRRLLDRLDDSHRSVGFVITGGSLGEGIDYRGDRLLGTIIVGVGLAPSSTESMLARAHHDAQGLNGYDTTSRYPGLVRVLQSAGRVVRTEQDRGVVMLVDARFSDDFYRQLLPTNWLVSTPAGAAHVSTALARFWAEHPVHTAKDVRAGTNNNACPV